MKHFRGSVALAIVAAAIIAMQCSELQSVTGNQRATLQLLEEQRKAAAYTRDTILAKNAEREVRDAKHADSLRRIVATLRGRAPVIVGDTVRLSLTEYRYVTDTLLLACEVCASRLDSAVAASRVERDASGLLIASQDAQLKWWVAHDKPHHSLRTKLRERVGFSIGYGITAAGGQVYVGPQIGISLRLAP